MTSLLELASSSGPPASQINYPPESAISCSTREKLVFSVVFAWEISLKPQLGIADAAGWLRHAAHNLQASILPVGLEHIAALEKLPRRHRDPFDRLLIAQAVVGKLALATADQAIRGYPEVDCVWD